MDKRKPIAIVGAGGLGKEVLALIRDLPEWEAIGFYDDNVQKGSVINGVKVLGNSDEIKKNGGDEIHLIIAVGSPRLKKEITQRIIGIEGIRYPTLIHPSAIVMDSATTVIGEGSVVGAGCILTTNISIGTHVLVNINSTIGHDCRIADYSSIMPGVNLSGGVVVGAQVLIGSGVNIMNGIKLGDGCKIGMGAVVLQNVDKDCTAVGIPAKMIRRK